MKRVIFLFFLLISFLLPIESKATIIYLANFESETCNNNITDAVTPVDGKLWDILMENPINPLPVVTCTGPVTNGGSKFVRWTNGADQHDNLIEILGLGTTSLTEGSKWYMATFARISKTTSSDVYLSNNSFDKFLEFRGTGLRWGIGAGYQNGNYPNYHAGQFIWDVWCAASAVTNCETSGGGPDHKIPNVSPYSASTPFYANYGQWYAIVIAITMKSDNTGLIEMWVNGVKTHNITQNTMNAGATIVSMMAQGTIGQPLYTSSPHTRDIDRWILTNDVNDITVYMSDPEAGGSIPVANFTCSPLTIQAPGTTGCTDSSTNTPTSWAWSGGCGTSTSQNPTLTCSTGGLKNICLISTNGSGSSTQFCRNSYITTKYKKPTSVRVGP